MDSGRLELLLHRYFDELLEPDERIELESMLLDDPAARRQFWDMAHCNALIRYWGEMEFGYREAENFKFQPVPVVEKRRESISDKLQRIRHWLMPITAAALGVIIATTGLYVAFFKSSKVATVTRLYQAQMAAGSGNLRVGQVLNRGWIRLADGAVEIELSQGARVVVQGPTELQLVSKNEVFLRNGKLNAVVPPPAHGFKVGTAGFSVVDHGTKFGCIVGADAGAEVHVFAGIVSWAPSGSGIPSRELTASQALKITGSQVESIPANQALFLSGDELARQDAEKASRWLQGNSNGLVYLDFENAGGVGHIVHNYAQNAKTSDVKMAGCKFVDGRFPGKTGIEFKNVNDHLRLTVPGEFDALTYLTWVRLDGLPPDQASLAMTESFTIGEVHWFVHYDGSFGLGIHTKLPNNANGWQFIQTAPGTLSTNLGSWIMLASTFDRTTGRATDYLNGKRIATRTIPTAHVPLHLDTFGVGNWGVSPKDPHITAPRRGHPGDTIRNLNGRLDEFAILATALSSDEIQRLYREGRPDETISDQSTK